MAVSQNGYPANDINLTSSRQIPGTSRKVRVRKGAAGDLLLWVAGQFDARVEDIDPGQLDDWGYAERPIRGGTQLSNHASGTAIDLNATRHPLGSAPLATFSAAQVATIRSIVNATKGCVRWGGDYTGRQDPMHFEIVASEARCATVLAALTTNTPKPSPQEEEMAGHFIDHEYPASADRQFHHRAIQTSVDSAVVMGGVWFELSAGYHDITDLNLYFNKFQAPIHMDKITKDQPYQWKVPEGCDSISFDYICTGPSSSLMIYGSKQ
jgi:hypothetical protein